MIDTIILNTRDNVRLVPCPLCDLGSWAGLCFIEPVTVHDRSFLPGAMLCLCCGIRSLRSPLSAGMRIEPNGNAPGGSSGRLRSVSDMVLARSLDPKHSTSCGHKKQRTFLRLTLDGIDRGSLMTGIPPTIVKWLACERIVQGLSEVLQRRFLMLCLIQSIPELSVHRDVEVSSALSISMPEICETKIVLMKRKLIDASWRIFAFGGDDSCDKGFSPIEREEYVKALTRIRMKRYRARKKAIQAQSEGNVLTMI